MPKHSVRIEADEASSDAEIVTILEINPRQQHAGLQVGSSFVQIGDSVAVAGDGREGRTVSVFTYPSLARRFAPLFGDGGEQPGSRA